MAKRAEVYCADCQVRGLHVHSVTFPDGREVVGPAAIAAAIHTWSQQPAVAAVFGRLIRASEAREREQAAS